LPLNRQSTVYAREGIALDVSTLADWLGAAAATLMPLIEAIRSHVFAAERTHPCGRHDRTGDGRGQDPHPIAAVEPAEIESPRYGLNAIARWLR
jgi:hypothetical protein